MTITAIPHYGSKLVRKSNGNMGWLYSVLLHYRMMDGDIQIMQVKKSERNLDRWRFANFSKDELENKAEFTIDYMGQFERNVLPWLRYQTNKWSVRVAKSRRDKEFVTDGVVLRLTFENPKDALVFMLYREQILCGEIIPQRRRKRAGMDQ